MLPMHVSSSRWNILTSSEVLHFHRVMVVLALLARALTRNLIRTRLLPQNKTLFCLRREHQTVFTLPSAPSGVRLVSSVKLPAEYKFLDGGFGQPQSASSLIVKWKTLPFHKLKQVLRQNSPLPVRRESVTAELLGFQPPFDSVM